MQYAQGYLELGMVKHAQAELAAVARVDALAAPVLEAKLHLLYLTEDWEQLIQLGRIYKQRFAGRLAGWINVAFAVRRLHGVDAAKRELLEAERVLGAEHPLLQYNLACYYCLAGELPEAKRRLDQALLRSPQLRETAGGDEDLRPLWADLAAGGSAPATLG